MSLEHADVAEWDAAYLLGALSPADRRAFEEHLESCERCVRAVAEVAPTLGLLARVDPERARSLEDAGSPQEDGSLDATGSLEQDAVVTALPVGAVGRSALLARAAREQRRRRAWWTGGLAAAAALLVAIAVGVGALLAPAAGRAVELVAVVDAPLTATAELAAAAWGTRIDLECSYGGDGGADASPGLPYTLVVEDREGAVSEVSSWRAVPGQTARLSAATALAVDDIAAVEIRMEETDEVLMRAEVHDE